jgi:glycosyltransferase involved in cell wall biosynthesis
MEQIISVIIPCRNEEKFIGKCLNSITSNDYPKNNLEILVIDGKSQDKTKEIIKDYASKFSYIKLLDNPEKYTPFALNIGIKESKGDIIVRIDSHATYEKNYIAKCVENLKKYNADNVGGAVKTISSNNSLIAKSIAICMSSIFGTGSSHFRLGSEKPMEVDTVFGGCYRKEVFKKIGLFNEKLKRSQDMEFNIRLKKAGGKIIMAPDIISYYHPKSTLRDFFVHNFIDGQWAILPLKFIKKPFKARHYIPLIFVSLLLFLFVAGFFYSLFYIGFLCLLAAYIVAVLYFSSKISLKEKDFRYFFAMPAVFASRHFGYGFGELFGLLKLLII